MSKADLRVGINNVTLRFHLSLIRQRTVQEYKNIKHYDQLMQRKLECMTHALYMLCQPKKSLLSRANLI